MVVDDIEHGAKAVVGERFDPVYTCYFKTNAKRISDYPNLLGFVRDVYSMPPIKRSINMPHIKTHYYASHPHLNTFAIIPTYDGPDLSEPSGRGLSGPSFSTTEHEKATTAQSVIETKLDGVP